MTKIYSPIDRIYYQGEWPDVVSIDWRPSPKLSPKASQIEFDDFFDSDIGPRFPSLRSLSFHFPVRDLSALNQYVTLQKLKCNGCSVKELPSEKLVNLTHLECRSNNISMIPEYPRLQFLDCSYNRLGSLTSYDGLPRTLVRLVATNCDLGRKIRVHYPHLTHLDIRNNRIDKADRNVFDNHIEEIDLDAPLLKHVYCNGNQLRSTRCFAGCQFLEYLMCCDNPLEDLDGLGELEHLKEVYACRGLVPTDVPSGDHKYLLIN